MVSAMARLTIDLELGQVRAIVRDLDSAFDSVGFARLHGGTSDVYRALTSAERASPTALRSPHGSRA
jgi:hypothetical protein